MLRSQHAEVAGWFGNGSSARFGLTRSTVEVAGGLNIGFGRGVALQLYVRVLRLCTVGRLIKYA